LRTLKEDTILGMDSLDWWDYWGDQLAGALVTVTDITEATADWTTGMDVFAEHNEKVQASLEKMADTVGKVAQGFSDFGYALGSGMIKSLQDMAVYVAKLTGEMMTMLGVQLAMEGILEKNPAYVAIGLGLAFGGGIVSGGASRAGKSGGTTVNFNGPVVGERAIEDVVYRVITEVSA